MAKVKEILDIAEDTWRETARTEFPLFMDMPVKKAKEDEKNPRHWMFYTDLKTIHMDIFKPKIIEEQFEKVIQEMYQEAYGQKIDLGETLSQRLIHDTLTYLYFHEQFHPTYCPDSKTDEKLFDKALYDAIQREDPKLSKSDTLRKVGNARNSAWDQVIDGAFFYLSNYGNDIEGRLEQVLKNSKIDLKSINKLPDAVIPIFDIIELEVENKNKEFESMFYPLTRSIYGLMFTKEDKMRGPVFDYFKDKIEKQMKPEEFEGVVKDSLKGFVSNLSKDQLRFSRINKNQFNQDVETIFNEYNSPKSNLAHNRFNETVNSVLLDKKSRYDSIGGFIEPLSKYISLSKEEKRHGTHSNNPGQGGGQSQPGEGKGEGDENQEGEGQPNINQPGGNTEQALMNLADILEEKEGNELLISVANDVGGQQGGKSAKDKRLYNLAKDEYYKRNVEEIDIKSPNYEAVKIELGKRMVPQFESTRNIPTEEVINLPLEEILKFQEETGITQLFKLSDYEYRFDEYKWEEIQDTDYAFENTGLDLPNNLIFHVDSSGSMGNPKYVGTGQPYDTLMHVCYGLLKSMKKAANEMKQEVYVTSANFSNGTILSKPVELNKMYNTSDNEAKIILTGFQSGVTLYSPAAFNQILKNSVPGKTSHVWATDGALNTECQTDTYNAIKKAVQNPDTGFLYFEIGTSSSFGNKIKQLSDTFPNVKYYPNVKIQDIQSNALEVLLEYS